MKLVFFNKRSGAVVMSPDSERIDAAVVAGVGSTLHSAQLYFLFLPIYIYIHSLNMPDASLRVALLNIFFLFSLKNTSKVNSHYLFHYISFRN